MRGPTNCNIAYETLLDLLQQNKELAEIVESMKAENKFMSKEEALLRLMMDLPRSG